MVCRLQLYSQPLTTSGAAIVPAGFYNAWRGQGFAATVLARLEGIIASSHVSQEALTIYVTGTMVWPGAVGFV